MATSLSNIILKYEEDEEPPPPSEGSDDESESGDESSEGGTPPLSSSKAPKMSKSELDDFAKKMMKELINPDEGECSTTAFEKEFEEFTDDMRDDHSVVVFTNATSDKNNYKKTLSKIDITKAAVLQKLFQRKSKDQAFVMKSMRSGRLDTNKIAEAVQNVPTIYERIGHIRTNKICVGVLIDESGSMGGSKIEKARQAAVFINEVFRKMPDVDLYIYGHTADRPSSGVTYLRIYREKGTAIDPFKLGSVDARSNNRDGDAILAFAKRVRSKTDAQGLLFVLSDGAPSANSYGGRAAIEDTRKKVQKAQSLGFQVIQIAIEESVPSRDMFDYFIKMTDIKNLPRDMVAYMSRKVDKIIRERVTV
jgi:nitric oxide reductase activation protein